MWYQYKTGWLLSWKSGESGKSERGLRQSGKSQGILEKKRKVTEKSGNLNRLSERTRFTIPRIQSDDPSF